MNISKQSFAWKLLVLTALTGTVLFGWLAGHILRYSIPAVWHPPVEEINPQIKIGYEFEYKGESLVIAPLGNPWMRVYIGGQLLEPPERCAGYTYYTSLPAKCRSVSGELVRVGVVQREISIVP